MIKLRHKGRKNKHIRYWGIPLRDGQRLRNPPKYVGFLTIKTKILFQALAVDFFKAILDYDYGAAWYHLRALCANEQVLEPPALPAAALEPVTGTPFEAANKDLDANVKLIFNLAIT